MNNYLYDLERKYKERKPKKHNCYSCGKPKKYSRYVNMKTGEYLPEKYGICDRKDNCGYQLNPYTDGYHLDQKGYQKDAKDWKPEPIQEPIYIPKNIFEGSLKQYDDNVFVNLLIRLFGTEKATQLVKKYSIGSSKYWKGATVFWIITEQNQIAGGQVVLFDESGSTFKEIKPNGEVFRHTRWVHTALKHKYRSNRKPVPQWLKDYSEYSNKFPVPFGLPTIDESKPIAIVEAPKTAIIASGYFPQYNWVAIGGASYLNNVYRIAPLTGKCITLYPDAGCYDLWKQKAEDYAHIANFIVSDLLERKGAKKGNDIADYLIHNSKFPIINEHGYPSSWDI